MARQSWLDDETQTPLIDDYARQLSSFLDAMADGRIDEDEVQAQEQRVAKLLRDVEPQLDDSLHAKVTQLLCEVSAYSAMQVLHELHAARPQTQFRG